MEQDQGWNRHKYSNTSEELEKVPCNMKRCVLSCETSNSFQVVTNVGCAKK